MQANGWNRAVTIEMGGESRVVARVASTREAAYLLLQDWPKKSGYYYHRAIVGCTMALKGKLTDEDARFYLTDAATDALMPYVISLGPAYLDAFDAEIAEVCDQNVFKDQHYIYDNHAAGGLIV
ncbi:MAG: hypothetical protein JWM58_2240 [Rhizobium sp.]|nr:hypothetical protein [Rhizobium sp.]